MENEEIQAMMDSLSSTDTKKDVVVDPVVDESNVDDRINDGSDLHDTDSGKPIDEVSTLKGELAELKAMLAELKTAKATEVIKDEDTGPVFTEMQDIDFFKDSDISEIIRDEDTFKSWFSTTMDNVRKSDRETILATLYKNIPAIIQKHVIEQVDAKETASTFYSKHDDLAAHKQTVAKTAVFVQENFPGIPKAEFFDKVAELTRTALGIVRKVENSGSEKPGKVVKPALVDKSIRAVSKRGPADDLAGIEKEIAELMAIM
jgi:hypothetical protein